MRWSEHDMLYCAWVQTFCRTVRDKEWLPASALVDAQGAREAVITAFIQRPSSQHRMLEEPLPSIR